MYNPGQEISSLDFGSIIGGPLRAVVEAQAQAASTTVNFIRSVGFEQGQPAEDGKSQASGKPIYVSFKYPKEIAPFVPAADEKVTITVDVSGAGYLIDGNSIIDSIVFGSAKSISADNFNIEYGDNGEIKSVVLNTISDDIRKSFTGNDSQTLKVTTKTDLKPSSPAKLTASYRKAATATPAVFQDMQIEVPILTMMPIPYIKIEYADLEFNVKINSVSNTSSSNETNNSISSNTSASYSSWWSPFKASTSINTSYSTQSKSSSTEEVKKDYSLNIKIHAAESDMPAGMNKLLDILEASIVNTPAIASA